MLIQIKTKGSIGFSIPISLFAIEQLMDSLLDLISLVEDIAPGARISWKSWGKHRNGYHYKLSTIFILVKDILNELRSYGRWRMVEIDTEDAKVNIQFL